MILYKHFIVKLVLVLIFLFIFWKSSFTLVLYTNFQIIVNRPLMFALQFREILGKGAVKTVYRGFDEVLGIEVAWNRVELKEVFHSPEILQRLYSEVHLLKNLDHDSIMRFYTSWVDINRRTFNFITEMFTSGTLRE